jgi:hypothetical protein
MNRDELRRTLERVREELARAEPMGEEQRRRLETLQEDLGAVVDNEPPDGSLKARLEDAVTHFEASHPDLSRSLAQVIDALALWGL